jgi:hypothetical protein
VSFGLITPRLIGNKGRNLRFTMGQSHSQGWLCRVLWEALTLNQNLYEDSHSDPNAVSLARAIVGLAALSYAVGSSFAVLIKQPSLFWLGVGLLVNSLSVIVGYYLWTYTIWQIHARFNAQTPPYRELLAPVGLAYTPQILNFITVIPLFGPPIGLVLAGWSWLAAIIAVRHGLNVSLGRASLLTGIGFIPVQIAIGLVQLVIQGTA